MNRRNFSRTMFSGGLLSAYALRASVASKKTQRIKPKQLQPGDTIGLITPGSYIPDEDLERARQNIVSLGFRVRLGKHIRAERGFLAGTDQQRLDDLHRMFADKAVAAVWCARGGYGCTRLLPKIDYSLIRKNPKVLIGYSDITALLQAVYLKSGLVGFHGPVGASEMSVYTLQNLLPLIVEGAGSHTISLSEENLSKEEDAYQPEVIRPGEARGVLMGGNLSLMAAMAGTAFTPETLAGKLLFLEDVGEKPYRIDRLLTQLRQAAGLKEAAGIALGIFNDCQPGEGDRSLSLKETLKDRLGDLGIPVLYGLSFGHIKHMCTFPIGLEAAMDTEKKTITILEPAVV